MESVPTEAEPTAVSVPGLLCNITRVQFGVPLALVDKLVEYEVVPPPPLSVPWVGGIGFHNNQVLLSITILRRKDPPPRRAAKGVLLKVQNAECIWALEVDSVASLIDAKVSSRTVRVGDAKLPPWITSATAGGQTVGWFNIEKLVEALTSASE
jgi:hypothetical protein